MLPSDIVVAIAVSIFVLIAVVAWLSAAGHVVVLLRHPAPGMTAGRLMLAGYRFYSRANFDPCAWPAHRRFLISMGIFAFCILGMAVTSAVFAEIGAGG